MVKIVLNDAAIERLGQQVVQNIKQDSDLLARIDLVITCDEPDCVHDVRLPPGLQNRTQDVVTRWLEGSGWRMIDGHRYCPIHVATRES